MTNSRAKRDLRIASVLLLVLITFALAAPVSAQSTPAPTQRATPVVIAPASDIRFQQAVQRQQVSNQLQQSQLEQQLRQGVSKNANRPTAAADPKVQQQQDEAARAQLNRDRASQQDLLNQYRHTPVLPRVVPKDLPPPDASKQGH